MNKKKTGIRIYCEREMSFIVYEKPIVIDGVTTTYRIRSNGDVISTTYQGHVRKKPYKMIGGCDTDGYHHVVLSVNGKKYTKKIHRLVAEAFISNPENKPEVNHIDGNKFNNNWTNLEWVTTQENVKHAERMALRHSKENKRKAILICKMLESNKYSICDICSKANVKPWLVKKIIKGDTWIEISRYFKISNYNPADHGESPYSIRVTNITKKLCKKICKEIESDEISLIDIARKYNVEKYDVLKIFHGKLYPEISKKYEFSNYTSRTSKYFKRGEANASNIETIPS